MELNRNSWWIKFYLHFNTYYPNNLCDYFWGSVKSIIISLFLITITLLLLFSLLSPILLFWIKYDKLSNLGTFQFAGIVFWFGIIFGFIVYKILQYFENKRYEYKPKKKSVIKQWYLDFKNKHCTLITWK